MSRKRRGNLKGWWMYLPFVLVPFSILFSEVWFQTQILNDEYRKNTLRATIRETKARVEELKDEKSELGRMERVLERAPDLGLVPPNPGQVIEIHVPTLAETDTKPITVVPVLAGPPPQKKPVAVMKAPATSNATSQPLEELEPLEPKTDWAE